MEPGVGAILGILLPFLMEQEGFSPHWYKDGAGWAIGFGHHRGEVDTGYITPMSRERATELLTEDATRAVNRAARMYRKMTGDSLYGLPVRHAAALVDIVYNTGSIMGWPKLVQAIKGGDMEAAAREGIRHYWDGEGWVEMHRRNSAWREAFIDERV